MYQQQSAQHGGSHHSGSRNSSYGAYGGMGQQQHQQYGSQMPMNGTAHNGNHFNTGKYVLTMYTEILV